ncbi:Riboflavin-specific deaminase [Caenispirillum salinarum AK4]|uniref:Riboflavin-specific deaminase n=1 Tax=Caenispirillum salinarum AK4 TaxID=1238182 RepID=K9H422_9PROT|nr:VOC family protein [Caenispirillum salinarum]EKV31814.1 Riboflavin-specific deaminase [Caenispirillum salinarum AK4]
MTLRLDHIAIGAASLDDGVAWLEDRLGVPLSGGGAHPRMGTHNRLLKLGQRLYLEVIAIDPDAPAPDRPRWFGLDDPAVQARLAERPRLLAWIARTNDIGATLAQGPEGLGEVQPMSRGDLEWRITVRPDGAPPAGGALPLLIQWPQDRHPADGLPESGCRLERLTLRHTAPERIRDGLMRLEFVAGPAAVVATPDEAPGLAADIRTPRGRTVVIDS